MRLKRRDERRSVSCASVDIRTRTSRRSQGRPGLRVKRAQFEVPVNKVGLATRVAGSAGARNTVDQIRTNQSPFACTSDVT